jgi:hypothetical protein
MKKANLTFLLIIVTSLLFSCKKKEEPLVLQPVQLMKINFTKGFVPNDLEVIVFISDSLGNLIAEMACPTDGTYEIFAPDGMAAPSNMMVTIVKYDFYWHNLLIQINTYTEISPTEWTIEGAEPEKLGDAVISFTNVPTSKAKVYSTYGYTNFTFSINPQTVPVNSNPDDFYVKLNTTPDEPKYKWLSGIAAGGNYELDLSEMSYAKTKIIQFPMQVDFFKAKLWGINNNDLSLALMTDQVIGDGNPANQVQLSYPAESFNNYRTNIFLQESFQSKTAYYYNLYGEIPESFSTNTAEILTVNPSAGQLEYTAKGNFHLTKAAWYFKSYTNEIFNWNVFTPQTSTVIKLPEIPPLVTSTFPLLSIDSLQYNNIELSDFQNQNSYFEVVQKIFNPAGPTIPEQLSYSSVLETPNFN